MNSCLISFLVRVVIAVMKHLNQKASLGEKSKLVACTSTSLFSVEGSQSKNLEAGADSAAREVQLISLFSLFL